MTCKNCVFCPIAQNFLLVGPTSSVGPINFWPQWPVPLALIVWRLYLPKIFVDWKYTSNYGTVAYCRLGNARRATLVAILPDNCHPSSFVLIQISLGLKLQMSRVEFAVISDLLLYSWTWFQLPSQARECWKWGVENAGEPRTSDAVTPSIVA